MFHRLSLPRLSLVFLVSLAITLVLQWGGNAYDAEWTGDADEPAHYVTGLLFHDYFAQGFPTRPMAYAQKYYDHYPKVALGHWPPVFYLVQAAWTLPLTASRTSLLLLMATIASALLTLTYAMIASYFPAPTAWGALIFLATIPLFQRFSRMVMAEMLVALLTLVSLLILAEYFGRPRGRTAAGFGLVSLAAILTKATGIAIAPLPLLGAAVLGRWRLLETGWFWLPALIVAVPALPWFLLAPDSLHQSVALLGSVRWRWYRIPESIHSWFTEMGPVGAALAALGFACKRAWVFSRKKTDALWVLAFLLIPVTVLFRSVIGAWETKHLLTTLPFLMLFWCAGFTWIIEAGFRSRTAGTLVAAAVLAAASIRNIAQTPQKAHFGLDLVARELVSNPEYRKSPFLILSDASGEGVFIAETAGLERRPGHRIERGTKVLASSTFLGTKYRLRYSNPEELMRFFEEEPDRIVILDVPHTRLEHVELVRETVIRYPDRWQSLGTYPRSGTEAPILVVRLRRS